jgi:hypothetical protein
MAEITHKGRIVNKHDTEENWLKATNFIPMKGELIVYDVDKDHTYERMKLGDGATLVSDLPFTGDADKIAVDVELTISGAAADAKVTGDAIAEINSKLADLLYEAISITSFTNNVNTVELGSTVTSVTLNWKTNKRPTTLTLDGATLDTSLLTHTYSGLSLTGGKSYTLAVTDERNASATKSTSISFLNGVYYGVLNSGATVDSAAILSLTRSLQSSKSKTFTTTAGDGQYIVYAVPRRYGTPAFNVGGFDGGFHLETSIAFTNASGYTETYDVYFSDNLSLGETTVKAS